MKPIIHILTALILLSPLGMRAAETASRDSVMRVVRAAESGDAEAMNILGGWYYNGEYLEQNYTTAARLWATAARDGNAAAMGNLALCYRTGHGVEADSTRATALYEQSLKRGNSELLEGLVARADKGDLFDCAVVGRVYSEGIGTAKDYALAAKYLTPVARSGNVIAERDLGLVYLNDKKASEAVKWFRRAAMAGDKTACYYYGDMLSAGRGCTADPDLGFVYLNQAADKGMPAAQLAVARAYRDGRGTTRSAAQADRYYALAAANGNNRARWEYAQICINNNRIETALDLLSQLVGETSYTRQLTNLFEPTDTTSLLATPFATFMTGMRALTVTRDYEAALRDFKAVGKAGIPLGKVMEYYVLAQPDYGKHNYKKAVKELAKLAPESPAASYILGRMYETGAEATGQDAAKAIEYYTSAQCADMPAALCALGNMYYEGRLVDRDPAVAADYYSRAAALGGLTAMAGHRYADLLRATDPDEAARLDAMRYPAPITEICKLVK